MKDKTFLAPARLYFPSTHPFSVFLPHTWRFSLTWHCQKEGKQMPPGGFVEVYQTWTPTELWRFA